MSDKNKNEHKGGIKDVIEGLIWLLIPLAIGYLIYVLA